ncbi:MAG TPA: hypothetical protein PK156_31880 [Polyangium sp.]|nr:hypothetical protein [Polyangium sp.]
MKKAFASVMAVGLALGLLPLGCGGASGEAYTMVQQPSSGSDVASAWTMPEAIVEDMRTCAREHARELHAHTHETKFELAVTEEGDVQKVMLRSSTLHHDELESCLMEALSKLSLPSSVLPLRSAGPVSGGESSPEARAQLGVAQAIGGAIVAAGPIILLAAGVTIAVYVAAVATEEAIEAISKLEKIERLCLALQAECLSNKRQPPERWSTWGEYKDCGACFRECKAEKGIWPDYKCPRPN